MSRAARRRVLAAAVLGVATATLVGCTSAAAPAPSPAAAVAGVALTSHAARPPLFTRLPTCVRKPWRCGFPDVTNTGVRRGVKLRAVPSQVRSGKGWSWNSEDGIVVTGRGAVLSGLSLDGSIEIKADDVVVRDVKVTEAGDWWAIGLYHANDVTIEHTTIASPHVNGPGRLEVGIKDIYGDTHGTAVLANNISRTSTGVQISNGLIRDNYLHNPGYTAGDHTNGTTSNAGEARLLTIVHNTVLNTRDQTDAISLFEDFGAQHNAHIVDNLVAGGSYSIYGGANAGGQPTSNIVITGNKFSTIYFPTGGTFGPVAAFDPHGKGNRWAGNVWLDGPHAGHGIGPYGQTLR